MGFFETLEEMQKEATGAIVGYFATILSIPHASIQALASAIQGEDAGAAADKVINWYAKQGVKIGRDQSKQVVRLLMEINRQSRHSP